MLWDDITTPWDRLTIWAGKAFWAIRAVIEWPDGSSSEEVLFNLTLNGVLEAIRDRGPHVGQVVWRRPRRETRYFNPVDGQYHSSKAGE